MTGTLYLCPTPIGNLEDITLRVLRILKEVDLIVAEDSRVTYKLLAHYKIKTRLSSYYKYNKVPKIDVLISLLKEGKNIALVSDAGTPTISDPGYTFVKEAIKENIKVVSLPGPNAILPALTISGISPSKFIYNGFLPKSRKNRRKSLLSIKDLKYTLVFFISCHDLLPALTDIQEILGNRKMVLVKEISKIHEKVIRDNVKNIIKLLEEDKDLLRGEFTLVIDKE